MMETLLKDKPIREKKCVKDLYEIGEIPPLGHVPKNIVCVGHQKGTTWCMNRKPQCRLRFYRLWECGSHEVLVFVMAAGVNYNGVLGIVRRTYVST